MNKPGKTVHIFGIVVNTMIYPVGIISSYHLDVPIVLLHVLFLNVILCFALYGKHMKFEIKS